MSTAPLILFDGGGTMSCPKCGGETEGWKCSICGAEADEHDPQHVHAGSDRYCTLKCKACGKADVHCSC
jgi:RecJ-like exonuclease